MNTTTKATKQAPKLPANLQKKVDAETTVSGRIRLLANEDYTRADIARILGKRYQHVRNVLEGDKLKAEG